MEQTAEVGVVHKGNRSLISAAASEQTDMNTLFPGRKLGSLIFGAIVASFLLCGPIGAAEEDPHHSLDRHLSETYLDDLPGLQKRKYIRVLTTVNRTNFFLADGKIYGFEYGLLKEYEKQLNKDIGRSELKLTLEFIPVSRERLLPGVVEGLGDIAAAGLTITKERQEIVAFTRPYLTGIDEILVAYKKTKPPEYLEALSGKPIFVRKSSSYFESLTALNRRLMRKNLDPVKIEEIDESMETEDILELVNTGAIERTVSDSHIAGIWTKVLPDIKAYQNIKFRKDGAIAWAVRKNNPKLKQSLDRFAAKHRKGTLLGNILFKRYYENKRWVKNPLEGNGNEKIKRFRPLFEKYADKYHFDWRLILAMAFQESKLNPKKKSPRGAVGLMQVLPSSAADPNVDIQNVQKPENNVHAAVKYLNFLRSRYFSNANIRPRDQVRFSLASYNAGPARILEARRKASAMHLDPNRWFRNVELAVLQMVGRETVTYVSNINKYYVIYKHVLEEG